MSNVHLSESVGRFAHSASFAQARAFVAGCAERACAVAFWAVAESTGEAAPDAWFRALDLLWEPGAVDEARVELLYRELQELLDAASDEGDLDSVAVEGFDAVHSGLGFLLWGKAQGADQIALAAGEFVAELGERAGQDLGSREQAAQKGDVGTLSSRSDDAVAVLLPTLRVSAAEVGRHYVAVAAAWRDGVAGTSSESTIRVTAVLDRSAVIAKYGNSVPRFGAVGRIVAGADAGRYVRVDRLADLAQTEEEGEAEGVMIFVADDPEMTVAPVGEWVEDWAGVEESFERDGHRIDWT
ncbi:hypothetical protein [Streptomyces solicathayae]|uniref:Uncharacterized protein n=1 Tax=Streptomyces solicathayae TaxID=3081768 RepID=A0ABZ0LUA7_9ACTN|nr:hypothetical protein [Streptomyces sp. HUAS YS2]WOX22349.1 hypothetical protein R2D22_13470 [Streptomyces sp. HUAS YS2]